MPCAKRIAMSQRNRPSYTSCGLFVESGRRGDNVNLQTNTSAATRLRRSSCCTALRAQALSTTLEYR